MGYYQPQSWMPTFAQQFPVPVPFIGGYPGYPLPSQHVPQSFTSSSGSESSAQNPGAQVSWASSGGVYPVCIRPQMSVSNLSDISPFSLSSHTQPILSSSSSSRTLKRPWCPQVSFRASKGLLSQYISPRLSIST
jgi:hypothetical protein